MILSTNLEVDQWIRQTQYQFPLITIFLECNDSLLALINSTLL